MLLLLLAALYGHFLAQKIYFVASDLGRHIRNGEVIATGSAHGVLSSNFYSYIAPDFPVLNHHWAAGVVFYFGWKALGFAGLHAAFVALRLVALGLFFDVARRRAGLGLASLVAAVLMVVLVERTEVRPEIFSYVQCGLFLWLLTRVRAGELTPRWLWLLPALESAWVNLHIYFFLGPAIIGAFWLEFLLRRDPRWQLLAGILAATVLATLVNPFGWHGAIVPFTIFQNYGLDIAENQSPFFMASRVGGITYVGFLAAAPLLFMSFAAAVWQDRRRVAVSDVLLAVGVTAMACVAIHNLTLFALFGIPLLAGNIAILLGARAAGGESRRRGAAMVFLVGLIALVTTRDLRQVKYWNAGEPGLGVEPGNMQAGEFLRAHNIHGPIFNNFDIGGYLIFHLWPAVPVFVDNRPEAYPAEFFRDVYWPMLKDRATWVRLERQFRFNAIIFAHTDMSPAAQQFLIDRMHDPQWTIVFCDSSVVIFVRRSPENADLIARVTR